MERTVASSASSASARISSPRLCPGGRGFEKFGTVLVFHGLASSQESLFQWLLIKMRKGGSKAAPSSAHLKAGASRRGSWHPPFKPSRSGYNRLVSRNCLNLLTMSTGGRSVFLQKPRALCANVHVEKWPADRTRARGSRDLVDDLARRPAL
jgi:hypothetical protein